MCRLRRLAQVGMHSLATSPPACGKPCKRHKRDCRTHTRLPYTHTNAIPVHYDFSTSRTYPDSVRVYGAGQIRTCFQRGAEGPGRRARSFGGCPAPARRLPARRSPFFARATRSAQGGRHTQQDSSLQGHVPRPLPPYCVPSLTTPPSPPPVLLMPPPPSLPQPHCAPARDAP